MAVQNAIGNLGLPENTWDILRFVRGTFAFGSYAKLNPTAALPGVWVIAPTTGTGYVFSIVVSSTVAIAYTLTYVQPDPNFAAATVRNLVTNSIVGAGMKGEAAVVAAPAPVATVAGGIIPANQTIELLPRSYYAVRSPNSLCLVTDIVAAIVQATIYFVTSAD